MKECKDIYELKDILYEKFDYWDVENLMKSIKRIVNNTVEEQIGDAIAEEREETVYWQNHADDVAAERAELQKEVDELKEKLKGYDDDEEVIPF